MRLQIADRRLQIEGAAHRRRPLSICNLQSAICNPPPRTTRHSPLTPPRGFSLLEIILVMALLLIIAMLLWPSVGAAFAHYHIERAAEDLQVRLAHIRLAAMEQGVPYAFTYRPDGDQFWSWACEPLDLTGGQVPTAVASGSSRASSATTDAYDRRYFTLNDRQDNREFRFLTASSAEALAGMGLGADVRASLAGSVSSESVAASAMLSQGKLGLVTPSARSTAALQIPNLQLQGAADPVVFEPDGTADKDVIIRVADRDNRYVEITVRGTTGAITTSSSRMISELTGANASSSETTQQPRTGFVIPTRSRETQQTQ